MKMPAEVDPWWMKGPTSPDDIQPNRWAELYFIY